MYINAYTHSWVYIEPCFQTFYLSSSSWTKTLGHGLHKNTPNMYAVSDYTKFWNIHNIL